MNFRYDINGLRALAVAAVVLFHFYPNALPGGFAGVDVFFVISGFLMTGIIFRSFEKKQFSLLGFYAARANRIIPPLFIMVLTFAILGLFFILPWDYKPFGRDIATSLSFTSNIMFSMRGGYFTNEENFLLHTWSLSAEWQFYMIFPILIMGLKKWVSDKTTARTILALTLLSYAVSIIGTHLWPDPSYYILPTRAWEMLFGGIAYLYPLKLDEEKSKWAERIGLVMILFSYVAFSHETLWPGYAAIVPVIGAYLVIVAQQNESIISRSVICQKIGTWSYSIYLWHWPITVSFAYYGFSEGTKWIGIVISILLGALSFHMIEKRANIFKSWSLPKALSFHVVLIAIAGVYGSVAFITQGFTNRVDLEHNAMIQGGTADNYRVTEGTDLFNTDGKYDYLVLGDSNSNHLVRGIINEGTRVKLSWYGSCLSFPNAINHRDGIFPAWEPLCHNNYKHGIDEPNPIILAQLWARDDGLEGLRCMTDDCDSVTGKYLDDLQMNLAELFEVYGNQRDIYMVGQLARTPDSELAKCLRTEALLGVERSCETVQEYNVEEITAANTILAKVADQYEHVHYVDVNDLYCDANNQCDFAKGGQSLFMTDRHLSGYGAELVWEHIMKKVKAIEK
ncbi:acyltransferase [Vibrio sp.]|nr:acyltransferase [Vibrio sp.]